MRTLTRTQPRSHYLAPRFGALLLSPPLPQQGAEAYGGGDRGAKHVRRGRRRPEVECFSLLAKGAGAPTAATSFPSVLPEPSTARVAVGTGRRGSSGRPAASRRPPPLSPHGCVGGVPDPTGTTAGRAQHSARTGPGSKRRERRGSVEGGARRRGAAQGALLVPSPPPPASKATPIDPCRRDSAPSGCLARPPAIAAPTPLPAALRGGKTSTKD